MMLLYAHLGDFESFSSSWPGVIQRTQQMKREGSVLLKKEKNNEKGVQHEDFLEGHPSKYDLVGSGALVPV